MSTFDLLMGTFTFLLAFICASCSVLFVIGTIINKQKGKFQIGDTVTGYCVAGILFGMAFLFVWIGIQFMR